MSNLKTLARILEIEETEERDDGVYHVKKIVIEEEGIGVEYQKCESCSLLSKIKGGSAEVGDMNISGADFDGSVGVLDLNTGEKVDISDLDNLPEDMPDEIKQMLMMFRDNQQAKAEKEVAKSESDGHTKH